MLKLTERSSSRPAQLPTTFSKTRFTNKTRSSFAPTRKAALASLREGPAEQRTALCAEVWKALISLATGGRRINEEEKSSTYAHCRGCNGIPGNERADDLTGEAAALLQEQEQLLPLDTRTVFLAAGRVARARTAQQRLAGWYRTLMEGTWQPRCPESTATQPSTYTS